MDIEDIVRLRKNWPHLVKYLKSKDPKLLDKLYQHAILNENEFTALQGEENPKVGKLGIWSPNRSAFANFTLFCPPSIFIIMLLSTSSFPRFPNIRDV